MDTQPKRMNGSFEGANDSFATQNVLFDDLELTGKQVKDMREYCGLSIKEWAQIAGFGSTTQHEIEHGMCANLQYVLWSIQAFPRIHPKRQEELTEASKIYYSFMALTAEQKRRSA
jgi:hypothetical protein